MSFYLIFLRCAFNKSCLCSIMDENYNGLKICSRSGNTVSPRRAELEATEFRMGRLRHERVRIPRQPDLLRSAMQV